ncbi:MAG: hypothetical protein J5552_11905 [Prevotella sp.]|nr:hypothetical protein [Prevotella sp.]
MRNQQMHAGKSALSARFSDKVAPSEKKALTFFKKVVEILKKVVRQNFGNSIGGSFCSSFGCPHG